MEKLPCNRLQLLGSLFLNRCFSKLLCPHGGRHFWLESATRFRVEGFPLETLSSRGLVMVTKASGQGRGSGFRVFSFALQGVGF